MSASALGLVLTAAVLHAVWNVAAKRVDGGRYTFVFAYSALSAVLWLPIGLIVLVADGRGFTWTLLGATLLSGTLHIGYGLALQTGYRAADLSVVYPVARGTGPLITMLFAILILADRPRAVAIAGGLVVLAGVAVVASARGRGEPHRGPARTWKGVRWGALTGVSIATYTLWDAHAMTGLALPPLPYFALGTFWQAALMVPGLRGRRAELALVVRLHWRESLCVAVLSPLAYVLVLQALTTTSVAVVAPARESSVVVGSLLAWRLFHEPAPLLKFAGATIVLAGIVLIAA